MDVQFVSRKKQNILLAVPAIFIAMTVLGPLLGSYKTAAGAIDLVGIFNLNILVFAWCRVDSQERGYSLHRLFSYAVVFFGVFAMIYYLFRSRGFVDGLSSVGWFLLYIFCSVVLSTIISIVITIPLIASGLINVGPSKN